MTDRPAIETLALHAGYDPEPTTGASAVPIYQTTSFVFRDTEHAANLFALREPGNVYTRISNPTTDALERRLAAMHGATGALAVASGQAATFYAVATICGAGQNLVSGSNIYGGIRMLFGVTMARFGIEARFVDSSDPANFEAATDENTRCYYTETLGNPACNVDDYAAIAAAAHGHGVPFIIDNTAAPPPVFNPFDHGVDVAVYSLTKMIGGHGTSIGGAIVEKGDFPWDRGARFPEICGPDPAYHGLDFWEEFGNHDQAQVRGTAYVQKIRSSLLRDTGACLSPFNAFLFIQGLETLPLRAPRHCENAQRVAESLQGHPAVAEVHYPGLPGHPDHERAQCYFPMGPGALFGFDVRGGVEAGRRFIESVKLCSHLANILDARTLVIHPASTTHQQLSPEQQLAAGVGPGFIRLSVGLEHPDDIIADLDQALRASQA